FSSEVQRASSLEGMFISIIMTQAFPAALGIGPLALCLTSLSVIAERLYTGHFDEFRTLGVCMRPFRITLLPIVTALFALTASRAAAHPGSSIFVDQKGRVFFIDSGGEGFLWRTDPAGKRSLIQK